MKKNLFLISIVILLSSCVGFTYVTPPNSVALNQGNFQFIKTVSAETKATYILGIGGMSSSATSDVVNALTENAELERNQALANIHIKTTTKFWFGGLVCKRTITATANVVEFYDTETKTFYKPTHNAFTIEEDSIVDNKTNTQVHSKGPKKEYSYELALNELVRINDTLQNENVENLSQIKADIKSIKKWYYSIEPVYMDIKNYLESIHIKIRKIEKQNRNLKR